MKNLIQGDLAISIIQKKCWIKNFFHIFICLLKQTIEGSAGIRCLLLIVVSLILLPRIFLSPEYLFNGPFFSDDLCYYFKPAINFWKYGFPTFDGITHTNGFQPLWMLLNIVIALPFSLLGYSDVFPYAVLVFNFVLCLYLVQLIYTLLKNCSLNKYIAALMPVLCLSISPKYYFNGMESSILLVSFGLFVIYLQSYVKGTIQFNVFVLTLLSYLVLMSRLDTGILLLLVYILLSRYIHLKKLICSGILLCLISMPYFFYNYSTQKSFVPISGQVKSFWSNLEELAHDGKISKSIDDYLKSNTYGNRTTRMKKWIDDKFLRYFRTLTFGFINPSKKHLDVFLYFSIMLFAALFLYYLSPSGKEMGLTFLLLCCSIFFFYIQLLYYNFAGHKMTWWHACLGILSLYLSLSIITFHWLVKIPKIFVKMIAISFIICLSLYNLQNTLTARDKVKQGQTYGYLYGELAKWLKYNTPSSTVIGSWAAGQIGFYSKRNVINLEGLIADKELLSFNKSFSLPEYILAKKVEYIAQHFPFKDFKDIFDVNKCGEFSWRRSPFACIRIKPILDFPRAFQIIHTVKNRISTGYVIKVDLETLSHQIEIRRSFFNDIGKVAKVLPAEDYIRGKNIRARLHIRDSNGFAITGGIMHYAIGDLKVGNYYIFGRFYGTDKFSNSFFLKYADSKNVVHFQGVCRWVITKLNQEPIFVENSTIRFALTKRENNAYVDELYLIHEENLDQFLFLLHRKWNTQGITKINIR